MTAQDCFLLLSLMLSLIIWSSYSTNVLEKGSSLAVEKLDEFLVSSNGIFAAGFHSIGINAFCFAIWFIRPSNSHSRTVVWMANRDYPVNGKHSKLSLLKDGNLVLSDAGEYTVWATDTVFSSSVQLVLHDNGNLILRTSDDLVLWESFNSPTDTLLPYQPLTRKLQLVSSRSQSNHSSGFYKLFFDDDNVLRLVFDGPETSSIYWPDPWLLTNEANRSRYNDTRIAVFDSSGYFTSSDRVEFSAADYGRGPWRRLTLDFDGNLRLYSLEKMTENWVVSWVAMTKQCRIHGACGPNSLCSYDQGSSRACSCLPGFKMKDHTDWSKGCEPKFKLSCHDHQVAFLELPYTNFYGYNIHILRNHTLERCKDFCQESCECKGFFYTFKEGKDRVGEEGEGKEGVYDCYPKWALRNGFQSPDVKGGGSIYLKIPKNFEFFNEVYSLDCSDQAVEQLGRAYKPKPGNATLTLLVWFASLLGVVEVICICSIWWLMFTSHQHSSDGYFLAANGFKRFTYNELTKATNNFSEEIGRGGGGVVYKGQLFDRRLAAIKRLNEANQGEAEFLAEVGIIGRLNHMNLIEMWGYCAEGKHRFLVYEYMEHGSLAENLYSNSSLDWATRFKIAMGTAKGLAYLHEECQEWVLHCDVKPQNILLDSNYQPKVADFGLSKLLKRGGDNKASFSNARGTRGYMAPEWILSLPVTSKADVYSYGVVVLEMVTGKSPMAATHVHVDGSSEEIEHRSSIEWIGEKMNRGAEIEEILDPQMSGSYDKGEMETLIRVALQCVKHDKESRPSMGRVVEMLQAYEDMATSVNSDYASDELNMTRN